MGSLRIKSKRSRKATRELILSLARHGRVGRSYGLAQASEEDVMRFFAEHGVDYQRFVEEQRRNYLAHVPLLWSGGASNFRVAGLPPGVRTGILGAQGEELAAIEGEAGQLISSAYMAHFERAGNSLRRAVETADEGDFLGCIASGISSIEAYLYYRARQYDKRNPGRELPRKEITSVGGERWLTFDERVDRWIPSMAGGRELDKSSGNWRDFKELRRMRDNRQAHPKDHVYAVTFREICRGLNLFRTGIAGLLIDLHTILGQSVDGLVFTYAYLPDIEYVED